MTPAVLHILLAVADEERHGYGIMREVEDRRADQARAGDVIRFDQALTA